MCIVLQKNIYFIAFKQNLFHISGYKNAKEILKIRRKNLCCFMVIGMFKKSIN